MIDCRFAACIGRLTGFRVDMVCLRLSRGKSECGLSFHILSERTSLCYHIRCCI